jgi:outer-membrane receptor for ferric coprogen and ferric-rhodotorulic acid
VPFDVTEKPYVVADARASCQIDANWRTALTINNVFDRSYYETIGGPERDDWYGEPRGFLLRIEGSY